MNSHGDRAYLEYSFSPAQTGILGGPLANQVGFRIRQLPAGRGGVGIAARPGGSLRAAETTRALFVQDDYRAARRGSH